MKQERKVIHVELLTPPDGYKKHYYFGSIAAIYDVLPKEVVGISKEALWNTSHNNEYVGRKAIIRGGVIHTKSGERGKRDNKEQ